MSENQPKMRVERDSMGPMEVPAEAYYGASTMRAVLNFPISNLRFSRSFIQALALIKGTAAEVNVELGLLDGETGSAMSRAAQEVADGGFDEHFVIDIFQTGSGTSTNMNANEVIATRASEMLGERRVHPNDHVNICQSSNDVIPTAIHLAALVQIKERLVPALENLQGALEEKSREFWPLIKTGRTHLQDATPIRLGQEFLGYAGQVERGIRRLRHAEEELGEVALGGTAVGTGVNAHPEFAARVCASLSEKTGVVGAGDGESLPGAEYVGLGGGGERVAADHRVESEQDSERRAVAGVGAEGWVGGAGAAGGAAGEFDYAGEGESGHIGVGDPGGGAGGGE